jgi:hypothetical protein
VPRLLIVALLLVLVLPPSLARAEINVAPSVEWLSAEAARIVVGKIVSLSPARPDAAGKLTALSLATVEVTETLKGRHEPKLCVGLRHLDPRQLERQRAARVELLLFLGQSVQATSYEKRVCNHWPLRDGAGPLLVPIGSPGSKLLSAGSFKVLRQRVEILAACKETLRRLAARKAPPALPRKHLLEVPFQSEAHKVLYSGSSCYLEVPDLLFPKARPSLGK